MPRNFEFYFPNQKEINTQKIENYLDEKNISHQHKAVFATRCVLRALPLLIKENTSFFDIWSENKSQLLYHIFYNIKLSYLLSIPVSEHTNLSDTIPTLKRNSIHKDYNIYTETLVNATTYTAYSIFYKASSDMYASKAAEFTATYYNDHLTQIYEDLKNINNHDFIHSKLWTKYIPRNWNQYFLDFKEKILSYEEGFKIHFSWFDACITDEEITTKKINLLLKQSILPEEIKIQTVKEINEYLSELTFEQKSQSLNLVRAIFLGNGGVGKTSLIRALHGEDVLIDEKMTSGVDIREWSVGDSNIKARLWDFGGQVISHATHQLFLRSSCLYLIILDARSETNANDTAEYWLEHVKAFGNNAPVMLVGNKCDILTINLNLSNLKEKYKNIVGFYHISCQLYKDREKYKFNAFKHKFIDELKKINTHQIQFSQQKFSILKNIRESSAQNSVLEKSNFSAMCTQEGMYNKDKQRNLLSLFDTLGEIIYFPDLDELNTLVLNPHWLTYGIYTLLYSKIINQRKGKLSLQDIRDILQAKTIKDNNGNPLKYTSNNCKFIINAMIQFRLCYPYHSHDFYKKETYFIIPDRLPTDQPKRLVFDKSKQGTLLFEFKFNGFLPRHIMPMFIVKQYKNINNNQVWQQGVILSRINHHNNQATACVQVDYHKRILNIWVQGNEARDYLAILNNDILEIINRMEKLDYQEWIYLPKEALLHNIILPENYYEKASYRQLLAMADAGKNTYFSEQGNQYDIGKILGIILSNSQIQNIENYHVYNAPIYNITIEQKEHINDFLTSLDKTFAKISDANIHHINKSLAYKELSDLTENLHKFKENPEKNNHQKLAISLKPWVKGSANTLKFLKECHKNYEFIDFLQKGATSIASIFS